MDFKEVTEEEGAAFLELKRSLPWLCRAAEEGRRGFLRHQKEENSLVGKGEMASGCCCCQ